MVSKQTVETSLGYAEALKQAWTAKNANDPRIREVQDSIDFLQSILNKDPQAMAQEGVSTIEEYLDDAVKPDVASRIKEEVDQIAEWRHGSTNPSGAANMNNPVKTNPAAKTNPAVFSPRPAATPAFASAQKKDSTPKKANGAAFVSDRDEKGEAKAPEKLEVPRLAAKDKKAAPGAGVAPAKSPTPIAAPAAPAAATTANPTPIPPKGSFDIQSLSTEALAKTVKALVSIKEFEEDKSAQALIEALTAELKTRPIENEEEPAAAKPAAAPAAPAKAAPLPMAASKKKAFDEPSQAAINLGGLNVAQEEEPQGDKGGVGDSGTGNGFTASDDKIASSGNSGSFVNDGETGDIVEDGGRTPEIGKAHSEKDEAPAKLDRPATTAPIKLAAEITTSKALKESERFGKELKRLYLDAKALTNVNETRPVREAVEAIFRAADLFNEATKTLSRQNQQEVTEAEAIAKNDAEVEHKNKGKKSSLLGGLDVASEELAEAAA